MDANLQGFVNVLEGCRHHGCRHLVFASSSSVYGANTKLPFRTTDNVDHPLSLYARDEEGQRADGAFLCASVQAAGDGPALLHGVRAVGAARHGDVDFRRRDPRGQPIRLFNHGNMRRDFTYVDDVVESVVRLIDRPAAGDPSWSGDRPDPSRSAAPWRIYNIGNNQPVEVPHVVDLLEKALGTDRAT